MSSPLSCPTHARIRAFSIGDVPTSEIESISLHIRDCPKCLETLASFDRHADALVTTVRTCDDNQMIGPRSISNTQRSMLEGRDANVEKEHLKIGRFELIRRLGAGSFGRVFCARDCELDRLVAVKIPRNIGLEDEEDTERFGREARSAAQLRHPGIVSLLETGNMDDGTPFLVSEYVPGETLDVWRRRKEPSFEQTALLVANIAEALAYAHGQGIVHRDIKPTNILIDDDDNPHLMDFGLAKRELADNTMTSDGRVLGTPAYMSPEQAGGDSHSVDERSDVYSLGVLLYEMLAGEKPFQGSGRILLLQVMEDEPRSLHVLNAAIPRALETICMKAMSKSPSKRYRSAAELADDLFRFLAGEPIRARPVGVVQRGTKWCQRNPIAAALFLAVCLGSTVGMWHLSDLSEYFVRETALESARMEAGMLDEIWRFYSDLCDRLSRDKVPITITENYLHQPDSLPLPATFSIDLAKRISHNEFGMQVRVYSRYPWPSRKDGGPRDAFERRALNWFEDSVAQGKTDVSYEEFTESNGKRELLYAVPRLMEKSCIQCHNDPNGNSSKKDWKTGDIAGVVKIVRPLDRDISRAKQGLRGAFLMMSSVSLFMLGIGVVMVIGTRWRTRTKVAQHE